MKLKFNKQPHQDFNQSWVSSPGTVVLAGNRVKRAVPPFFSLVGEALADYFFSLPRIIAMMSPEDSWVSKWQRVSKYFPFSLSWTSVIAVSWSDGGVLNQWVSGFMSQKDGVVGQTRKVSLCPVI